MVRILLLCAMLFQAGSPTATKPIIDNERVTVREVTSAATPQPLDSVIISFSGSASFAGRGTTPKISGRSIIITLKDNPVAPIANPTSYPLAFPRPGSKKLLENERVIVWDSTWQPGVAGPMHFHDKDVVVWFLEDGDLKSTTPDGKETINHNTAGMVRFNKRDRSHFETLVSGKQHAIITELK